MRPATGMLLAAIAAGPGAALAQERMSGLDFMVDWPGLVGRHVIVEGGEVYGASDQVAFLDVPGGSVQLSPPWADREDLRYVFAHCTEVVVGPECRIDVAGQVGEYGGLPELQGADFLLPGGASTLKRKEATVPPLVVRNWGDDGAAAEPEPEPNFLAVDAAGWSDALPVRFAAQTERYRSLPIASVLAVKNEQRADLPGWPFTADTILIACAGGGMNLVQSGGAYSALNGATSGLADVYRVEDSVGVTKDYVRTASNELLREAGIVRADAADPDIGSWWTLLNRRLQKECP